MRNYLITGASSDIGMEYCRSIAAKADCIVATANSNDALLLELKKEVIAINPKLEFIVVKVNLANPEQLEEALADIAQRGIVFTHFLHLPSLMPVNAKLKNFNFDNFYTDFELQVGSAIRICKAILPKMSKAKFGRVVFMLTSYIESPPKNMTAYITVKSALAGLCKSLAADYASFGITFNGILPSMIETKFLQDTSNIIVEAAAEAHPLGRNATVGDVVPAIQFLLSDEAGYITGTMLSVTGGS